MFFCEICEIFKNTYFVEHLLLAASDGSESDESENDDENYNEVIQGVVHRCSSRLKFLKISQISQGNTYVGVSL